MNLVEKSGGVAWQLLKGIMYFFVNGFMKICHKELTDQQWEVFLQFIKFGIIGLSNTVVSYVINVLALLLLERFNLFPNLDYVIANITAFILSVLWSFYWNNKYVFRLGDTESGKLLKALLKTYCSYAFTGIVLCNVLSYIWIDVLGISKYIAPLINSIIGVPINFLLNKFWAFKG